MTDCNMVPYEPADIVIHVQGRGTVLREKSLIAVQASDNKIVAFGTDAQRMTGKNMEDIMVLSPLHQGMIADYLAARELFSCLFRKALGKKPIIKPPVAVCVPKGMTSVDKKAMEDAVIYVGASELLLSDVPMEEFIREFPDKFPKLYRKFKITIGITKDEPERYMEERMRELLAYAEGLQIPAERVYTLWNEISAAGENKLI